MSSLGIDDWPPLTLWLTALILALVLFVIVLPAVCTACYHWYSYRKGWDDDFSDCDSDCDECNVGTLNSGLPTYETINDGGYRYKERWRYYCRVLQAAAEEKARLTLPDAEGNGDAVPMGTAAGIGVASAFGGAVAAFAAAGGSKDANGKARF